MKLKGSSHELKRHKLLPLFVLLLLLPYVVGFTSDSTTTTYSELRYGAGVGQYVYHDCSGAHTQRFEDAGIYYGKKFNSPFRIGLTAGGWHAGDKGTAALFVPDLALDWRYFSLGTTGIRIGAQEEFYFESRWLDQPPLLSGKGMIRSGIGWKVDEPFSRFWIGVNVIPYSNVGISTQIEFPYDKNKYLFLNGRFGSDRESGMPEYGFSVGMRIISF